MRLHILARAARRQAAVSLVVVAALLANVLFAGYVEPPDLIGGAELSIASRCQGGGPGCAEQPMIPPPLVGLPRVASPEAPAFGAPVLVVPAVPSPAENPPPLAIEHPPELAFA
jgi:hypothetical protein